MKRCNTKLKDIIIKIQYLSIAYERQYNDFDWSFIM